MTESVPGNATKHWARARAAGRILGAFSAIGNKRRSSFTDADHFFKYVIVGGGVAGACAANEFRHQKSMISTAYKNNEVCLITREDCLPYERHAVSKGFLSGQLNTVKDFHVGAAMGLPQHEEWYQEAGIKVFLGCTVTQLNVFKNRIVTDTHGVVAYDKLLLCTGAAPRRLQVPGDDQSGIYFLRSAADAQVMIDRIKELKKESAIAAIGKGIQQKPRAIVIGGGFIALESAASLTTRGLEVTLVFPNQTLLSRLFSTRLSELYRSHFEANKVRIRSGVIVTEFARGPDGYASAVHLNNGLKLEGELFLVAIGATIPKDLFAGQLDIQGRGIRVNEHMQTSEKNVYAVGDICSYWSKTMRRHDVTEHVWHARYSARHAVRHMLGKQVEGYDYTPQFYSRELFGLSWDSYGDQTGRVITGCGNEDRIPVGQRLHLGMVWVNTSGKVNGVLISSVEQAKKADHDMAKELVRRKTRVDVEALEAAANCDEFMEVLRQVFEEKYASNHSGSNDDDDAEQPCLLSNTYLQRTLQKLAQEEYLHIMSEEFVANCAKVFFKYAGEGDAAQPLNGDRLQSAVRDTLAPHHGDVFLLACRKDGQMQRFVQNFGGRVQLNGFVEKQDFCSFVRFCLAWCMWRGFDVRKFKGHAIEKIVRDAHNETMEDFGVTLPRLPVEDQQLIGKVIRKWSTELSGLLMENRRIFQEQWEEKMNEADQEFQNQLELQAEKLENQHQMKLDREANRIKAEFQEKLEVQSVKLRDILRAEFDAETQKVTQGFVNTAHKATMEIKELQDKLRGAEAELKELRPLVPKVRMPTVTTMDEPGMVVPRSRSHGSSECNTPHSPLRTRLKEARPSSASNSRTISVSSPVRPSTAGSVRSITNGMRCWDANSEPMLQKDLQKARAYHQAYADLLSSENPPSDGPSSPSENRAPDREVPNDDAYLKMKQQYDQLCVNLESQLSHSKVEMDKMKSTVGKLKTGKEDLKAQLKAAQQQLQYYRLRYGRSKVTERQ
eukprot:gnl/MRDRNA2_/MRDRNA2_58648_c0_seq2.p1 gnl/MRDRNA2_/MRDRNA2_58648_c0~~gnl/MRDRNA2_/MRDRNA2_58648_c0_seq2.p1  ORF type:complete len:1006 (+),score=155.21 gnl/MRDRNA2_/MRDRNA2_58648_c0_seq2:95-3112(+)